MNKKIQKLLALSDKILDYAKPISLNILLTYQCNFSCKHCYIEPERVGGPKKISIEEWKRVLKYFRDSGTIYLRISGGEPTICSEFVSIYNFAWELGYKIEIATNGYLLSKYFELFKVRKPYLITFSLYGISNETYSDFCGIKDVGYDNLLTAIEFCDKQNIDYKFNYILTSYNSIQLEEIYKLSKQKGWKIFCLRNLQNDTDGNFQPIKCQASINDVIKSYYVFNDARKKVVHFKDSVWIKGYKTCYSGVTHFNINPFGEIYLCNACFRIKHKIKDNVLETINIIREDRREKIEKESACSRCSLKNWCGICSPIYSEKINSGQFEHYCSEQKFIYNKLRRDFMVTYKLKYKYDFSEVEGDYIVTPKNGETTTKALVINKTTYKIMELLQKSVSISEIVEKLSEVYTESNIALFDDVKKVVEELEKSGLVMSDEK